jgi:hypothetical protein
LVTFLGGSRKVTSRRAAPGEFEVEAPRRVGKKLPTLQNAFPEYAALLPDYKI